MVKNREKGNLGVKWRNEEMGRILGSRGWVKWGKASVSFFILFVGVVRENAELPHV